MKVSPRIALALLLALAATSSCKKDYLDEMPRDVITPGNLYVNKAGFESGLYGLYNLIRRERAGVPDNTGGPTTVNFLPLTMAYTGVDNAFSLFPSAGGSEQIYQDFGILNTPINGATRQAWEYLYQVVNAANTLIGRAENPDVSWSAAEKNQIVGEARLVRAWAYRHLTYLYGDVPLNLVESDGNNVRTDWERTPVADVRKQMEADLLFAEANMAESPPTEARFPRAVATHYLAELYLTIGDNQKAKDKALTLTQGTRYKLMTARYGVSATQPGTPFTDMFLDGNSLRSQGNNEVLWALQNEYQSLGGDNNIMRRWWVNRYETITVGGKKPFIVSIDNGGRGLGRFGITRYGLGLYGSTDDRGSEYALRLYWKVNNPSGIPSGYQLGSPIPTTRTSREVINDPNWPNTRKWDWAPTVASDVQSSSGYNDQMYLRLGETYLFLAEAQFKLGDATGAAATLNTLRARAKATAITAADVTLDFILDERSRELVTEEQRRYTLVRTGTYLSRVQRYNALSGPKVTQRDVLLPIPQSAIDANLSRPLGQNPGY